MAAPLLAELLGGTPFLGFIAAVAFATILAVVAGLTLAGASAFSHDIYVSVIKGGHATEAEQMKMAKRATMVFGVAGILLGILFKGQNVAFMVGLAFAIACSANFPALILSILWKKFTTAGAVSAVLVGTFLSVGLIFASSTVWGEVFKFTLNGADGKPVPVSLFGWLANDPKVWTMKNPAIISMTASFIVGWVVSLMTSEPSAEEAFEDEKLRTYLGIGAE
jgi:cation/acetate symporter